MSKPKVDTEAFAGRRGAGSGCRAVRAPRLAGHRRMRIRARRTLATSTPTMGHAAMIGRPCPGPGRAARPRQAPDPAHRAAAQAGACARVRALRDRQDDRDRPGRRVQRLDVQRHRSRPDHPGDRGRSAARPLPEPRLAPAHDSLPRDPPRRTWTASSRSWSPAAIVHVRVSRAARPACTSTTATRRRSRSTSTRASTAPSSSTRRSRAPPAHELVMVMNGFDTDGDGENNFYTVNGKSFYYAKYPIRVQPLEDGADLPREPDRVRPHQLVPPPRRLLPLLPERDRPTSSSTRTP